MHKHASIINQQITLHCASQLTEDILALSIRAIFILLYMYTYQIFIVLYWSKLIAQPCQAGGWGSTVSKLPGALPPDAQFLLEGDRCSNQELRGDRMCNGSDGGNAAEKKEREARGAGVWGE